jgi:signal transduction histidine kinase
MTRKTYELESSGVMFFGTIVASISHEIKNILAIINENTGLLEDLSSLAIKGHPLDPVKLDQIMTRIKNQVQRGDGIIQNMNLFAHSTDEPIKEIELCNLLKLVAGLTIRFAILKGHELTYEPSTQTIKIRTRPFELEHLLWLCLKYVIDNSKDKQGIILRADQTGSDVCIRISFSQGLIDTTIAAAFPTKEELALLKRLNADLSIDTTAGVIALKFPIDITK